MVKVKHLSEKVIESKDKVILLQEQLLGSKEDQLATLQTSVREEMASVQSTDYSQVGATELERNCEAEHCISVQPAATFTPAKLKDAVRSAVEEEE